MSDRADADQAVAFAAVQEQTERCRALLEGIGAPNARILARVKAGDPAWSRLAAERYNRVCAARGDSAAPLGDWLVAIRDDPDLEAVCDARWLLGEAVDTLRARLDRLATIAPPHDDLERCIRNAVTGPDRSPAELAGGVDQALAMVRRAVAWKPPVVLTGTLFDRWMEWLKNNPVVAAILIAAAALGGAATLYRTLHDSVAPNAAPPSANHANAPAPGRPTAARTVK
jgi:hypothetical protein